MNLDLAKRLGGVLIIAIISGVLFKETHNYMHAVLGADQTAVILISAGIGVLSFIGYMMWVYLSSVRLSTTIAILTAATGFLIHLASHMVAGFSAVSVVGGWMFWLGAVGTLLNYFLRG